MFSTLKKILIAMGAVFLVVVIATLGFVGFLAYKGSKLDSSSKAYVDESIARIVATWSAQELLDRASPELIRVAPPEQMAQLFQHLNLALGSLREHKDPKGQSRISFTTHDGKVISANYIVEAEFERANATINIGLIQHNGSWEVLAFRVDSPTLSRQ